MLHELEHVLERARERDRTDRRGARREAQEASDRGLDALQARAQELEVARVLLGRQLAALERLDRVEQPAERVVDLVRDARRELAHRRQAPLRQRRRLRAPRLGRRLLDLLREARLETLDLGGHLVERADQLADLVGARGLGNARGEVAARDASRGARELLERVEHRTAQREEGAQRQDQQREQEPGQERQQQVPGLDAGLRHPQTAPDLARGVADRHRDPARADRRPQLLDRAHDLLERRLGIVERRAPEAAAGVHERPERAHAARLVALPAGAHHLRVREALPQVPAQDRGDGELALRRDLGRERVQQRADRLSGVLVAGVGGLAREEPQPAGEERRVEQHHEQQHAHAQGEAHRAASPRALARRWPGTGFTRTGCPS